MPSLNNWMALTIHFGSFGLKIILFVIVEGAKHDLSLKLVRIARYVCLSKMFTQSIKEKSCIFFFCDENIIILTYLIKSEKRSKFC